MTVPATSRKAGPFTGTGLQTVFPFSFKIFAITDVKVVQADLTGAEATLSTGYTVSMNSDQVASPGGSVTLTTALVSGYKLSILGNLPYDQTLAVPGGGNFNPVAFENALDRIVEQVQQIAETSGRAVLLSSTSAGNPSLPAPTASTVLGWDASGAALQNYPLANGTAVAAFVQERYTATAGQTVFTPVTRTGCMSISA